MAKNKRTKFPYHLPLDTILGSGLKVFNSCISGYRISFEYNKPPMLEYEAIDKPGEEAYYIVKRNSLGCLTLYRRRKIKI